MRGLVNQGGGSILTGDAVAANVLAAKTFYSNDPKTQITGTMIDRGTVSTDITAKAQQVTIAAGKHSGSGVVQISAAEQAKVIAANIKSGITLLGQAGSANVVDTTAGDAVAADILASKIAFVDGAQITGTMVDRGAVNFTPSTTDQTIAAGKHSGSGVVYGDADLAAGNIKSGINIFGVAGNITVASLGGKRWASGTATSDTSNFTLTLAGGGSDTAAHKLTVTGLTFTPTRIIIRQDVNKSVALLYMNDYVMNQYPPYNLDTFLYSNDGYFSIMPGKISDNAAKISISSTGFIMPVHSASTVHAWEAYE